MAPRGKDKSGGGGLEKARDPLIAIVLADTYNQVRDSNSKPTRGWRWGGSPDGARQVVLLSLLPDRMCRTKLRSPNQQIEYSHECHYTWYTIAINFLIDSFEALYRPFFPSPLLPSPPLVQCLYPLTIETPMSLVRLVHAPMIEYTLEWLASSKIVDEIIVLTTNNAEQLEAYMDHSSWVNSKHPKLSLMVAKDCKTVGDALRTLDQKEVIKGDFILTAADVVTNMDLAPAFEAVRDKEEEEDDE